MMIEVSDHYIEECNGSINMDSLYADIPLLTVNCSWNYSIAKNMQEIIPGLFLGSYFAAQKNCQQVLLDAGITHIICVRHDVEAHFIHPQFNDTIFNYLILDIDDNVTENIIRFFPVARKFIDGAMIKDHKVLVHGNSGNSRSATLVLAYIMEKFGLNSSDAFHFVKEKRSCINPNEGFIAQLTEYEPIYKARQSLENGETSSENRRQKRKSDHLCESFQYDLIQPPPSPISLNNNEDNYISNLELSNRVYRLLLKHT